MTLLRLLACVFPLLICNPLHAAIGSAVTNDVVIDTRDWDFVDTNGDGSDDTIKLNLSPRIGDQLDFNFSETGFGGTYKLVGKLPAGMIFNAATGVLKGKLSGKPGTSVLRIQNLRGKTVVRDIRLNLSVAAFPTALTGTWQALLEGSNGLPQGLLTTTLTAPGKWTATLDVAGSSRIRRATGTFQLDSAAETATISMKFPAAVGLPMSLLTLNVNGPDALVSGSHSQGVLRGFRLARGAELPAIGRSFILTIDRSEHNGALIPANEGHATLAMMKNGTITLRGKLGDGQAVKGILRLGVTGQSLLWLKPYRNLSYCLGGVLAFHDTGAVRVTELTRTDSKLWWHRASDSVLRSHAVSFKLLPAGGGK